VNPQSQRPTLAGPLVGGGARLIAGRAWHSQPTVMQMHRRSEPSGGLIGAVLEVML